MLYSSTWAAVELTSSVVIATDCLGSWKPNYHKITVTTAPYKNGPWIHYLQHHIMYTNISYACDHHFKDDKGHYLFFQNIFYQMYYSPIAEQHPVYLMMPNIIMLPVHKLDQNR